MEENLKVVIGVPCMEDVKTDFMQCVIGMEKPCHVSFAIAKGSLVYDARNKICEMAINNGFDFILWIDSDMTFEEDVIERFAEHYLNGKDYVSGIFFSRKQPIVPCVFKTLKIIEEDGHTNPTTEPYFDYPNEVFEIEGSGFAGVMTSVKMVKEIALKHGTPFYPRYGYGEDLSFCYMAKQDGWKMYCDPSIKFGHIGYVQYTEASYKSQKGAK